MAGVNVNPYVNPYGNYYNQVPNYQQAYTGTPPVYQYQQTPPPQQANPVNPIVWVQGEAGAKAYPVPAGQSMILMDSDGDTFYLKSTDNSGMPRPLRSFAYKEIIEQPKQSYDNAMIEQNNMDEYVKKADLEEFKTTLMELKRAIDDFTK